ncbi:MAG: hypothetical protein UR32_C0001G0032 [candidate division WS6 bacterium GW2011_GWE2_33_157]|nr:MAG: hypothetical protein UR32_C0001G0032 [candidate division WS6 bacterium GW2011_GWE2_33_157]KKP45877.1 MAG: hypothetical protein UR36_C0003G0032 [candidate division WS6 bacterium GW2011_GWF1_33_233]KKP55126.1 MAG: hypothetical protein UR45_C0004G0021 [candidate division WS6 bacterium GW2011_WS6_33_547]
MKLPIGDGKIGDYNTYYFTIKSTQDRISKDFVLTISDSVSAIWDYQLFSIDEFAPLYINTILNQDPERSSARFDTYSEYYQFDYPNAIKLLRETVQGIEGGDSERRKLYIKVVNDLLESVHRIDSRFSLYDGQEELITRVNFDLQGIAFASRADLISFSVSLWLLFETWTYKDFNEGRIDKSISSSEEVQTLKEIQKFFRKTFESNKEACSGIDILRALYDYRQSRAHRKSRGYNTKVREALGLKEEEAKNAEEVLLEAITILNSVASALDAITGIK